MATRTDWRFYTYPGSVDLTSHVKSFSRFRGKRNYLDEYSGQPMTVTIRNNANQVASWVVGSIINVGIFGAVDNQYFWISEVQFNDEPGTTTTSGSGSNSTATIIMDDWMTKAGRIQLTNFSLSLEDCLKQMWNQITTAAGALPSDMLWITGYSGFLPAAAATYTGTVAARINLNLKTEGTGAQLYQYLNYLDLRTAAVTGSPVTNAVTLQPAKNGATGNKYVVYQNFKRISAGNNFLNTVTVVPPVAASQTATNATSVTTYGKRFNSVSTANNTTGQAAARAQWLANVSSDPNDLRFEVTFTDVMQDNTGVTNLLANYASGSIIYLKYVVPGSGVLTTEICSIEGISYSGTPSETVFVAYLSPMNVYANFILDSTVYGVLDENRLGVSY